MGIVTKESGFEYQISLVFVSLQDDYNWDMKQRKLEERDLITFADWLHTKEKLFGASVLESVEAFSDIDEATKCFNVTGAQ